MKLAIGYIRVSTDGQAEEGVSLAAQERQVRAYAELYGFALVGIETDAGASAATLERRGLTRALAMLERGEAEALIVPKLDRLARSVRDLDTLLTRYFAAGRYSLISVADYVDTRTAGGRMTLNFHMSVAQWEREIISERTKAALAHKRQAGERVGQIPYGYRLAPDGVRIEADPEEQLVVARIRAWRASGHSLRGIVKQLNAERTPARGVAWYRPTVTAIIEREEGK